MNNLPTIIDIEPEENNKKPVKEELVKAMNRGGTEVIDPEASRLQISMDVVSMLAARGVKWAVMFVRDTLDGKPAQEVVGEIHNKITVEKRINLSGLSIEQLQQLESLARLVQQGPTKHIIEGNREGEV